VYYILQLLTEGGGNSLFNFDIECNFRCDEHEQVSEERVSENQFSIPYHYLTSGFEDYEKADDNDL
jgi:hypothetical protein